MIPTIYDHYFILKKYRKIVSVSIATNIFILHLLVLLCIYLQKNCYLMKRTIYDHYFILKKYRKIASVSIATNIFILHLLVLLCIYLFLFVNQNTVIS